MENENAENETVVQVCYSCDSTSRSDDMVQVGTGLLCSDCRSYCERCEEYVHMDYAGSVNNGYDIWCNNCIENYAHWCDRCESHTSEDNSYINDRDEYWCESCASNWANWCDGCDTYNADSCDCDDESVINHYSYKPDPIFLGNPSNQAYFGLELETEIRGSTYYTEVAQIFKDRANANGEVAYLKEDASIGRGGYCGFEIVTHPMSFEYAMNASALYEAVEHIRDRYKARSWDGVRDGESYLGLHIHISRKGFKSGAHMHRFLALIYKNSRPVIQVAGRKTSYAKFSDCWQYDEYDRPYLSFKRKVGTHYATERYSAVNTQNEHTIELRFFRGTMSPAGIKSSIQLAQAMLEYTRDLSVSDVRMGALDWEWFKSYVEDNNGIYPELYDRLNRADGWSSRSLLEEIGA